MRFDVTQDRSFDPAIGKIDTGSIHGFSSAPLVPTIWVFDLRRWKLHRCRITARGKLVDNRSARITKREQFGDFIERLAGGIVACMADVLVRPTLTLLLGKVEMSMPSRNDQSQHGKIQPLI